MESRTFTYSVGLLLLQESSEVQWHHVTKYIRMHIWAWHPVFGLIFCHSELCQAFQGKLVKDNFQLQSPCSLGL